MSNCIFCAIIAGDARGDIVYQDDDITALRDIHPVAPTHVLIVPNRHIAALSTANDGDAGLIGRMVLLAAEIAEREGIAQSGYRLVTNQGRDAGQLIDHLHWHVIGGRRLGRIA